MAKKKAIDPGQLQLEFDNPLHKPAQEYLDKYICPICKLKIVKSDYLAGIFHNQPLTEYIANLITHYRHSHITSWNKMWGEHGRSYRKAAKFGNYDEEKAKVNERAKRQLIRSCHIVFKSIGITSAHFTKLKNTDEETMTLAKRYL